MEKPGFRRILAGEIRNPLLVDYEFAINTSYPKVKRWLTNVIVVR